MVVCFALRQNIKVIPLDVMFSAFDEVSNGSSGIVIFSEGLKVFGFPIMKLSFTSVTVTDPDLELRGRGTVFIYLSHWLFYLRSFLLFLRPPPGHSPRFATKLSM